MLWFEVAKAGVEDLVGNVVALEVVALEEAVDRERAVEKRFLLKILTLI